MAETGQRLAENWLPESGAGQLQISPNGLLMMNAARGGSLRFWNPSRPEMVTEQIIYSCPEALTGAVFSPDGSLALSCDGSAAAVSLYWIDYYRPGNLWLSGKLISSLPGSGLMSFNRDGALLAVPSGTPARQILIWNVYARQVLGGLADFPADILQAEFRPNGRCLESPGRRKCRDMGDTAQG